MHRGPAEPRKSEEQAKRASDKRQYDYVGEQVVQSFQQLLTRSASTR